MDLIIYLSTDWKSYSSNNKGYFGDVPLIRSLSRLPGIRILCVNQPFTPVETSITKKVKAARWMSGNRLEQLEVSLFLYTPFALVHDMLAIYSPVMQRMNRAVLSRQLRKQLGNIGFDSPIRASWIYHPLHFSYFGLVDEVFKVYKCWDLYGIRDYSAKLRKALISYEVLALKHCNVIFTPCINLYKKMSKENGNTYFIPGGVDLNLFGKGVVEDLPIPQDLVDIRPPRIGFAGNINEKVDMHLIRQLAESHPDWSIVMLGNISGGKSFLESNDYRECRRTKNIHFLTAKDFEFLPSYMNCFDVCMLAHSNIESMQYAHPYKTLQYLAVGKPVVSTDIPDAQYYKDVIRIAKDTNDFVALVEESLKDNTEEQINKRMDFVRRNTWDRRAEETYEVLMNMTDSPRLKQEE